MEAGHIAGALAQVVPSSVSAEPHSWSSYLFVVAISGAVAWFIENRRKAFEIEKLKGEITKLSAEVRKLTAEEIKLAGEVLSRIQDARSRYADGCVECRDFTIQLVGLLKQRASEKEIGECRNNLCHAFTRNALHEFVALVEWRALSMKNSPAELAAYVKEEVCPEIDRFTGWLNVINMPLFTKGFSGTSLKVSAQTVRPIACVLDKVDESEAVRADLTQALAKLCSS